MSARMRRFALTLLPGLLATPATASPAQDVRHRAGLDRLPPRHPRGRAGLRPAARAAARHRPGRDRPRRPGSGRFEPWPWSLERRGRRPAAPTREAAPADVGDPCQRPTVRSISAACRSTCCTIRPPSRPGRSSAGGEYPLRDRLPEVVAGAHRQLGGGDRAIPFRRCGTRGRLPPAGDPGAAGRGLGRAAARCRSARRPGSAPRGCARRWCSAAAARGPRSAARGRAVARPRESVNARARKSAMQTTTYSRRGDLSRSAGAVRPVRHPHQGEQAEGRARPISVAVVRVFQQIAQGEIRVPAEHAGQRRQGPFGPPAQTALGGEVVDEQQLAARPHHPAHLPEQPPGIRHDGRGEHRHRDVETAVRERHRFGIHLDQPFDVAQPSLVTRSWPGAACRARDRCRPPASADRTAARRGRCRRRLPAPGCPAAGSPPQPPACARRRRRRRRPHHRPRPSGDRHRARLGVQRGPRVPEPIVGCCSLASRNGSRPSGAQCWGPMR